MNLTPDLHFTHPSLSDLPQLLTLLNAESLDVRRLQLTADEAFPSLGEARVKNHWQRAVDTATSSHQFSPQILNDIKIQATGILNYQPILPAGQLVRDPFNLKSIEDSSPLEQLQASQLENILIGKRHGHIIVAGRVLPVEGSWEIVSIITKQEFRGQGLGSALIQELLRHYPQRPLYSFQKLSLVHFYLKTYQRGKPRIPAFPELPAALQRDLFYMNMFWEPNVIIEITE
ncbi:MAG TPA: GNAT family N-acetyltransferase [Vitreimonas sp.]|nr:GNAT family N-acetyltransferase [Vitreimonas sp.]